MDQRVQFIADYQRAVFDIAELARRYGISRKTAYKWIERYEIGGTGWAGRSVTAAGALSAPDAPGDHRGPAGGAATPSDLGRQEAAEGGGDPTAHLDASSPEHGLRPVGSRGTHHSARAASGAGTPGPAADPNDRAQRDVDGGL